MSFVLILGANSDIGKALATCYAKQGHNLYLATRQSTKLSSFAAALKDQFHINYELIEFDSLLYHSHSEIYHNLSTKPDGVIVCVGYLGNHTKALKSFDESELIIHTNFTGIVSMLNIIANDFEKHNHGFIVGISSVAGDRGRQSNYIYGSAKAALSTYLSGLRHRLAKTNVSVLTVKPGFVNTKMTHDIILPKRLTVEPFQLANKIYKAQQSRYNILYSKWIWKWIMFVIKSMPECIFKKTTL